MRGSDALSYDNDAAVVITFIISGSRNSSKVRRTTATRRWRSHRRVVVGYANFNPAAINVVEEFASRCCCCCCCRSKNVNGAREHSKRESGIER